jgi:hypothetical protein
LAAGHKLVLAFANLSRLSEHKGVEATAGGWFTEHTKNGVSTNLGDGSPLLIDSGITEVKWKFKADKCWARGTFVIMAFD